MGMSIFGWLVVIVSTLVLAVILVAVLFFFLYVEALKEAHRDGWDMPS